MKPENCRRACLLDISPPDSESPLKPELPVDIIRVVFECAATHSPTGATLCRVSRTVQAWVAPVLYFAVVFPPRYTIDPAMSREQIERTWHHTRHFFLQDRFPDIRSRHLGTMSRLFSCLHSLVFDTGQFDSYGDLLEQSFPSLTHLTILGRLDVVPFERPIFRTVTHLHIVEDFPFGHRQLTPKKLPRLAHVICSLLVHMSYPTARGFLCLGALGRNWDVETLRSVTVYLVNPGSDAEEEDDSHDARCAHLHKKKVVLKPAEEFNVEIWKGWMRDGKDAWSREE